MEIVKGANWYQKVVGQNGAGQGISWFAPKNLLFKGYFCPEQRLSAMNFRGGAEKW